MASGPCLRRCRVVRRYIPIRLQFYRLAVKLYHSSHVPMYFEPFWERNAVNTGVPCPKVPMHRKLGVEQINRELKTDLGLGAHQVSREERRIEKSFGIAVLAYLLLIRACHEEILPGTSWSIAQLQHALRLRIITNQVEHNVKTRLPKVRKVV